MGWRITLKADRPIVESDIQKIVDELPEDLQGHLGTPPKQYWGWPAATDILVPKQRELTIRGSYSQSGRKAKDMLSHVKGELKKLGYKIRLVDDSDF
jgi:hypothetical protein